MANLSPPGAAATGKGPVKTRRFRATAFRLPFFFGPINAPRFRSFSEAPALFHMYKAEGPISKTSEAPRFDFVEGRTLPFLSRDPLQVGRLTGRRHAATRTQPGRLRAGLQNDAVAAAW